MTTATPTLGINRTVDTEAVTIPVYDLDSYCRQQNEERKGAPGIPLRRRPVGGRSLVERRVGR